MPTLLPVGGQRVTRSLTVFHAISDMRARYWRTLWKESSQARNQLNVPSFAKIRKDILPDVLAVKYLNDAIEIISRNAEISNYKASFDQDDFSQDDYGGWSIAYPTAAYRIDTVLYTTGTDEGKTLEDDIIDIDELEQRVPNWRNAGTVTPPRSGVNFKKDRFGLYPKPSDSSYTVYLIGVGKPAQVGYDTGTGAVSTPVPADPNYDYDVNDTSKTWIVDQFNNGIMENEQNEYEVYDTTSDNIQVVRGSAPALSGTIDFRVDNIIPLPDEFHGLCIDTAMNIFLSGGAMAAEEVLLKSQTFRRLKGDLQSSSYIEPFKADGSFNSNRR